MAKRTSPTPILPSTAVRPARSNRKNAERTPDPTPAEPTARKRPAPARGAKVVNVEPELPLWFKSLMWLRQLAQGLFSRLDELIALALMAGGIFSMLALLRLTGGEWSLATRALLNRWLGWGAVFAPLSSISVAVLIFWKSLQPELRLPWRQILLGEISIVLGLGLAHALLGAFSAWGQGIPVQEVYTSGSLLEVAGRGDGGGLVGWTVLWAVSQLLAGWAWLGLLVLFVASVAIWFGIGWSLPFDLLIALQNRLVGQELSQPEYIAPEREIPVRKPAPKVVPTLADVSAKRAKPARVQEPAAPIVPSPFDTQRPEHLPSISLLQKVEPQRLSKRELDQNANIIIETLKDFGIEATYETCRTGPAVTQYLISPTIVMKPGLDGALRPTKVRVSQIANLQNDLTLALNAVRVRIEAPVPGTSFVGIEVPNMRKSMVGLRTVIESESYQKIKSPLAFALGADVSGKPVAADLSKMPHLLVAGTTGSGKSVCITSIIACLVFNNTPEQLRLVLIDPKKVELIRFNGLPHLLGHVEVELQRIIGTLRWMVREMERRYRLFEQAQARDIKTYNAKMQSSRDNRPLPYIVVVIDELADLMMQAPDETERMVARLAQMARATGIHLVVATQRPSTDVVTGLIKANFPARIAFMVASGVDSRVILDMPGAETLLGKGDMLFQSPEAATPQRMQGVFVREDEIEKLVKFWQDNWAHGEPELALEDSAIPATGAASMPTASKAPAAGAGVSEKRVAPWEDMLARQAVVAEKDDLLTRAIELVKREGNASASLLQRRLKVGYPRAARLMDELKEMGLVGDERQGGKTREVFIGEDDDPIGDLVRYSKEQRPADFSQEDSVE